MADCEKLKTCPFFTDQMAYLPVSASALKQSYCHGDNSDCARYLVAIKGISVPRDLYPNELHRAEKILASAAHRTGTFDK